jgi:hypothetical protein
MTALGEEVNSNLRPTATKRSQNSIQALNRVIEGLPPLRNPARPPAR